MEFKSAWDRGSTPRRPLGRRALRDKIADVVAAFANAGGGLVLVGVDDDGTAKGRGYPDHVVDDLFAVPRRRLTPAVACRTERIASDCHKWLFTRIGAGFRASGGQPGSGTDSSTALPRWLTMWNLSKTMTAWGARALTALT